MGFVLFCFFKLALPMWQKQQSGAVIPAIYRGSDWIVLPGIFSRA